MHSDKNLGGQASYAPVVFVHSSNCIVHLQLQMALIVSTRRFDMNAQVRDYQKYRLTQMEARLCHPIKLIDHGFDEVSL